MASLIEDDDDYYKLPSSAERDLLDALFRESFRYRTLMDNLNGLSATEFDAYLDTYGDDDVSEYFDSLDAILRSESGSWRNLSDTIKIHNVRLVTRLTLHYHEAALATAKAASPAIKPAPRSYQRRKMALNRPRFEGRLIRKEPRSATSSAGSVSLRGSDRSSNPRFVDRNRDDHRRPYSSTRPYANSSNSRIYGNNTRPYNNTTRPYSNAPSLPNREVMRSRTRGGRKVREKREKRQRERERSKDSEHTDGASLKVIVADEKKKTETTDPIVLVDRVDRYNREEFSEDSQDDMDSVESPRGADML